MIKVDFLFIYEVKNREFENICLLRVELEKKGYRVAFLNSWDSLYRKTKSYDTEVLVIPACYNDGTFEFFTSFAGRFKKVVNLQWEQIFPNSELDKDDTVWIFKGISHEVTHISWGEKNAKWLEERCGIPQKNIRNEGHVGLDFFRPCLESYYMPKAELFKKYGLDQYQKVFLFASSFTRVNLPKKILKSLEEVSEVERHHKLSVESQKILLEWFIKVAKKHPEIAIVYRAHPAEADNAKLKQLEKACSNFYVISELSIRQWIICCDQVYTWYSTSVIETYMANKPCYILRPKSFPWDLDISLYENASFIISYALFEQTINPENKDHFPLSIDVLCKHYEIDKNIPTYIKICGILEEKFASKVYFANYPKVDREIIQVDAKSSPINKIFFKLSSSRLSEFIAKHTKIKFDFLNRKRVLLGIDDKSNYDKVISDDEIYVFRQKIRNRYSNSEMKRVTRKIKKSLHSYNNK